MLFWPRKTKQQQKETRAIFLLLLFLNAAGRVIQFRMLTAKAANLLSSLHRRISSPSKR